MRFVRYNLLTLAGNAVWCLSLAGIGWGIGTGYRSFDHGFRYLEYAVVAGIVLLLAYGILRRRRVATVARRAADR